MGVLDFPAPLFLFFDDTIALLPAALRLTLWGVVGGALSMVLYAVLSPQKKIAAVKAELRESQAILAESDESFSELLTVVRKTLGLSFKHLGLVFGPALLSGIPLICIMAWASTRFGYGFPEAGDPVTLSGQPAPSLAAIRWQASGVAVPVQEAGVWTLRWPDPTQGLVMMDADSLPLLELPLAAPVPQVHKRLWWNSLLGNPAGYLPEESPIELVEISLPPRRYLPFGPDWAGHWLTVFLVVSVAGALLTKKLFKIH